MRIVSKLQSKWRCVKHSKDHDVYCYSTDGNICLTLTHGNLTFWALEIVSNFVLLFSKITTNSYRWRATLQLRKNRQHYISIPFDHQAEHRRHVFLIRWDFQDRIRWHRRACMAIHTLVPCQCQCGVIPAACLYQGNISEHSCL